MSFWIFFIVPLVALILIAVIVDMIAKSKGKKVNLERSKSKKRNKTADIYSESLKQDKNNLF